MACDNHNDRRERPFTHSSPVTPILPSPMKGEEIRKGSSGEEKKGKERAGFFARMPAILSNDRGSTAFYAVFVMFMAIVVYFKFYYTPSDNPNRPIKIDAPRGKPIISFGNLGVRQAPANETASVPAVAPQAPKAGSVTATVNDGNRAPSAPQDTSAAETRLVKTNAPDAGGYTLVVQKSAKDIAVEKGMYSKEGSHFTVKFDGGENAVAGNVISILLEEAYIKVGADFGFYPKDRVDAVLYMGEQFRDVTRSPSWAGALYDGRIKVPAGGITEKSSLLETTLFHEYTHALVQRISHGKIVPFWLNEGIAQYEEGIDDARFAGKLREFAKDTKKEFSLRYLEGSFTRFPPAQVQFAYLLSLSATRYIIREFGVSAVKRILESLASGQDMDGAVRSSIYISYDDLEKSWLASLTR